MGARFEIKIENADQFERLFRESPKVVAREIHNSLDEASGLVLRDAVRGAPIGATAQLQNSLTRDIRPLEASVFTIQPYAPRVEFGSGGRGKAGIPARPVSPSELFDWARRKLGDEGLAYPISKTISKFGTSPHPFMLPAKEKNERNIIKLFERAIENIVKALET